MPATRYFSKPLPKSPKGMTTWATAESMEVPAATGATRRVRRSRCCNSSPQPASDLDDHCASGRAPKFRNFTIVRGSRAPRCPNLAEREGFEPPIPLRVCRISSAVLSTTQPPLRRADLYNVFGQAQARACAACGYFALETPSDGPLLPYF